MVAYDDSTRALMLPLIGHRIELPAHYDMWMRGARFGTVTGFRHGKDGIAAHLLVKMDHPSVKHRVKVWKMDVEYTKVLD